MKGAPLTDILSSAVYRRLPGGTLPEEGQAKTCCVPPQPVDTSYAPRKTLARG